MPAGIALTLALTHDQLHETPHFFSQCTPNFNAASLLGFVSVTLPS